MSSTMIHRPLKRHASLQPLSRDHYVGLVTAAHLMKAAVQGHASARRRAARECIDAWDREILSHFDAEEDLLAAYIHDPDQRERVLREHRAIRAMVNDLRGRVDLPSPMMLEKLGCALNDHIRWEERELFPAIETAAGDERLEALLAQTRVHESRRNRSVRWSTCRPAGGRQS